MQKFLFIFVLVFSKGLLANDSLLVHQCLQNILNKQQLETDFFVEGSFKSYRQYNKSSNLQEDNNIFFTALIAYTLQNLKPKLNAQEKIVVDTIVSRAKTAFTFYKNKKRNTYNFWRTDIEDNFFPNDDVLKLFKKQLKLPDDLDDTSIIIAVLQANDSTAKAVHNLMLQFANKKYSTIKNTYKKYKNTEAYSTWYGVRMPVDFDFGVHCNILSFVNKYKLPWSKTDSATYNLLLDMIDNKLYKTNADYISPYYAYTSVLLYHLARLMETKNLPELESRKHQIIKDIKIELKENDNVMYKNLMAISLLKLGDTTFDKSFEKDFITQKINSTDFIYYTGHIFGHLNNTIKKLANSISATQFKWFCSAYNDCLVLEYLIWKRVKLTTTTNR